MAKQAAGGFGVAVSGNDSKKFNNSKWGYKQQKFLALIVAKIPEARAFLGINPGERLSWEYGGWSKDMIAKAHETLDKYSNMLPKKEVRRF